jgi:hypothetical protein
MGHQRQHIQSQQADHGSVARRIKLDKWRHAGRNIRCDGAIFLCLNRSALTLELSGSYNIVQ